MGSRSPDSEAAALARKGVTPPKGRPTRRRGGSFGTKRAFGPIAQWITVAVLIVLVVVALILITDGGDFNPFNDGNSSQVGSPAVLVPV